MGIISFILTGNEDRKETTMFTKGFMKKNNLPGLRAQAIVEFAIVFPVLIVLLVGLLEVGRMLFIYSAVTNASRNAVRYASAYGRVDSVANKYTYNDCAGIRDKAIKSAYLMKPADLTVTIKYDSGPGTGFYDTCDGNLDTGITVSTGKRVYVEVAAQYKPMVKLIPFPDRTFTSKSYRTILGIFQLGS
jgi:Flp pilus assembly protein TadG